MGKIRVRKRTRSHLKAKSDSESRDTDVAISEDVSGLKTLEMVSRFSDVTPLPEVIMKAGPVLPLTVSTETQAQPREERSATKKNKRKMRHEKWLQKIDVCRRTKEASKAAEERRKTVVVGDMQPLVSALPQLQPAVQSSKPRKESSKRSQKTSVLSELDHFQRVLEHPAYKSDALGAIEQHISNSVQHGLT